MNFFVHKSVAERYAKHRPYFHPLVIERIKARLHLQSPVPLAVDVGCGAGQSTVALKDIAVRVVGMDLSLDMLQVAEKKPGIRYVRAVAERLAIQSNTADLLTTSLAYHWFDQEQFFTEVRRVLREEAWLVIYNNWIDGQLEREPAFEKWFTEVYEVRYPSPKRNSAPVTVEFAEQHGFRFVHWEEYQNEIPFSVQELAAYLITQSNVIAATGQGQENVEEVYNWLIAQIKPFFKSERVPFPFGGFIWYLQKVA
ncbi:MAG TPA: class I SAM-dependent methyltransferase [Anaerolineales bacterium]|nr:class I SAM-dependent methyltransferase [Anaerolineales bacterium]